MDHYTILAEKWGITREQAKIRAFGDAYGRQYKEPLLSETLSKSEHLTALGSQGTSYVYDGPSKALLETFPNPMKGLPAGSTATIEIDAPEFTSLCPKTGQPDFARILVEYQARDLCVESKSFKLYLGSFRQAGEFHEACITRIASDLIELLDPAWIQVKGEFTPRGGISFWPMVDYSRPYRPGDEEPGVLGNTDHYKVIPTDNPNNNL